MASAEGFVESPDDGAGLDVPLSTPGDSQPQQEPHQTRSTSVLRLRGLPYSSGEDDVRSFFSGFDVQNVVMCRRNGRASGEAYVKLGSAAEAGRALAEKHRQAMGTRYIEVFESNEADIATAKNLSVDRLRGFVVRMRGLPYTATANDVLTFFGDIPVVRGIEGIVFTYAQDGRPTGEAYVEFQDEAAQRAALEKHKQSIGSRWIELFVSTKTDLFQAVQQNRLVLGYANRRRWLQQQGFPAGPPGMGPGGPHHHGPHHHGPRPPYGGMVHHAPYGGGAPHQGMQHRRPPPPHQHQHQQYGQVEEVTDMMAGFNMGGQPVQVIGPGGVLPGGAYQLELSQQRDGGKGGAQQRYPPGGMMYSGRSGGRGGGRMGGFQMAGGRGGPMGAVMGRGMPQAQIVVAQPMGPSGGRHGQVQVQGAQMVQMQAGGHHGHPAVMTVQEVPGQMQVQVQQGGTTQYIIHHQQQQAGQQVGQQQYEQGQQQQQQWAGQAMIAVQQQQQQQHGGQGAHTIYATTQQQGMSPGTYTLTAIQMPSASAGTGSYDYHSHHHHHHQQQVHVGSLQALEVPSVGGTNGLQAVELGSSMGNATLQIEVPVSALGAGGEMLLQGTGAHRGGRFDGQGGM